jgi:hypothetical protein
LATAAAGFSPALFFGAAFHITLLPSENYLPHPPCSMLRLRYESPSVPDAFEFFTSSALAAAWSRFDQYPSVTTPPI